MGKEKRYICPVCGKKITERDVRTHAERHGYAAYIKCPSFAPLYTYVAWYFAYIWLKMREVND